MGPGCACVRVWSSAMLPLVVSCKSAHPGNVRVTQAEVPEVHYLSNTLDMRRPSPQHVIPCATGVTRNKRMQGVIVCLQSCLPSSVKGQGLYSAQFSSGCSVRSNSLRPHGLQHARLPYHQLPELTQTHVHRVSNAIQPSHPLSSPSPPAFDLSQHQDLFQ